MAITSTIPNAAKEVYPYGVNLATATIKCALFTSSATIAATSTLYSALDNEVSDSGTGYTTGGVTLTDLAWTGTTIKTITGTIPSWDPLTATFRYAVIYDTSTSKIIGYYDFGTDQQVVSGTLTLTFHSNGFIKVTST